MHPLASTQLLESRKPKEPVVKKPIVKQSAAKQPMDKKKSPAHEGELTRLSYGQLSRAMGGHRDTDPIGDDGDGGVGGGGDF